MKKLALLAFAVSSAAFFSLAAAPQESSAGDPCVRKEFKTRLVRDACQKGGQAEAKKTMKKFFMTAKEKAPEVTACKSCHATLSPDYKLTSNALELFKKAGGK
ncbi:hypothetical protein [Sorangium sp. So ce1078]|uniref:hypothetical protein n=1 Tax=Sorangium sp. So ce1078 TaxID=3133329 RepID=UPI003F626CDE